MDIRSARSLFGLRRETAWEVVVHGAIAVAAAGEAQAEPGLDTRIVARSLLKPWQFLAAGGAGDGDGCWALGLASHSGQPRHETAFAALAAKMGAVEAELVCPASWPMDGKAAWRLETEGHGRARHLHPCSGKHLLFWHAAKRRGLNPASYAMPSHPVQAELRALVAPLAPDGAWLIDSCGLPTLEASLRSHLALWQDLATSQKPEVQALRELWLSEPLLVGGEGRLDSELVEVGQGRVLAKEGADGLLAVQTLPLPGEQPVTIFIKIASGYQTAYLGLALGVALERFGAKLPAALEPIKAYIDGKRTAWVPSGQTLVTDGLKAPV